MEVVSIGPASRSRSEEGRQPRPNSFELDESDLTEAIARATDALGDPTRRRIYLFVRENGGASAPLVANEFGLHPNVARHHLDKLCAAGYLVVSARNPGPHSVGRPSKRYLVAPGMAPEAPRIATRLQDLLLTLLDVASEHLGPEKASELAEAAGQRYGEALAAQLAPEGGCRSMHSALGLVADALSAHGFDATRQDQGGSHGLVAQHCPFGAEGGAHPIACALDKGMVRGMLEGLCGEENCTNITMSSRAMGDEACITSL